MIDLRLIRCAVMLDRHRNFARAATAIGVTQPTFSRSIAALEAEMDTRLFDRSTRTVEPTAAGRVFLQRAAALLADAARLREEIDEHRALGSGELAIGVGPYPLEISVLEAVARLAARHPAIRIELIEGQWREFTMKLLSGEIELAIAETSALANEPRLTVEALPRHPGVAFCRPGHPLAGRKGLTLPQLLAYPIVSVRMPGRLGPALGRHRGAFRADPRTGDVLPHITTTSFASTRAIVKRTDGIGFAADVQLAEDLGRGELAILDFDASAISSRYGLVRLRDRTPSAAAQAFMQLLRDVEQGMSAAIGSG
jgi:DNA-binding transcriptional LysR family regulator